MQENPTQTIASQGGVIDYSQVLGTDEHIEQDPMELLRSRAVRNLKQIGIPGINEILAAFGDTDDQNHNLTIAEFRLNYLDLEQGEVTHSQSMLLTMSPVITLEKTGAYHTIVLTFPQKKSGEMNRLWSLLSDYGAEMAQFDVNSGEVPFIGMTVIPMTLGGQYGMVASDPIFYHLQPSSPMEDYCNQIRLLFAPESVMFLRDDSFKSDEVLETVKMELAAERINEEALVKEQLEAEEFQKEHEKEMQEYLDHHKYGNRSFTASKNTDGKFKTSAPFKEGFQTSTQKDTDK